ALAKQQTVQRLSDAGLWTVDLLNDQRPAPTGLNVLVPTPTPADVLVKAVVTSASIPVAFPTVDWGLQFTGRNAQAGLPGPPPAGAQTGVFHHRFVDGGVADNSPIDVAVAAGATHVLSIELAPLGAWTYDLPARDTRSSRTMLNVYNDSFDASMQACIASGLRPLVANHAQGPRVFRIGPRGPARIPGKDVPAQTIGGLDTFDFDGAYAPPGSLRLNLYDGFMQGYLEARHFASNAAANNDPVVVDYHDRTKHAGSIRNVTADPRNQFWEVGRLEVSLVPPN
ncbi:MAG: Patatin-like phospholipase, partial [Frankiaceae bacterium]|nr:Patatin-like phospholipase [Frankiaceae bacterium]